MNATAPSGEQAPADRAPRSPGEAMIRLEGVGKRYDDGTVAVTVVPPPVLVSAVRGPDGRTATFTWKTGSPERGDQFTWLREGTTTGPSVTADPTITLTGLTPGVPVCLDVSTVRAGRTSEPLKACAS